MTDKKRKKHSRLVPIFFWLFLWQTFAVLFRKIYPNGHILLATPVECIRRLFELSLSSMFWKTAVNSAIHILAGFFLGSILAVFFASFSSRFVLIQELFSPIISVIKSVPVVSFIILALIWIDARNLALFISALVSFPPVYLNILSGINSVDLKLLEMAKVYKIPLIRKIYGIYIPSLLPYFTSAVSLALGMCWKAGVSAEVIGLSAGTIGEKLYTSKIYYETADLFAWSITVVAMSALIEKIVLFLLKRLTREGRCI